MANGVYMNRFGGNILPRQQHAIICLFLFFQLACFFHLLLFHTQTTLNQRNANYSENNFIFGVYYQNRKRKKKHQSWTVACLILYRRDQKTHFFQVKLRDRSYNSLNILYYYKFLNYRMYIQHLGFSPKT